MATGNSEAEVRVCRFDMNVWVAGIPEQVKYNGHLYLAVPCLDTQGNRVDVYLTEGRLPVSPNTLERGLCLSITVTKQKGSAVMAERARVLRELKPPPDLFSLARLARAALVQAGGDLRAFDNLVGVDRAVEAVKAALELPIMYPETAARFRLQAPKGILFYGPPGTGKTSLAKATARYFACPFRVITPSEILRPLVGSSEQAVAEAFQSAREAAAQWRRPAILFFDEIDALGRKRDGMHLNRASDVVLNQLLAEMDGVAPNSGVFVMAATNRIDVLDEALLRPGRFDQLIEVGLPDTAARAELFRRGLYRRPVARNVDPVALADLTEGMSPAAITKACDLAARKAASRAVVDPNAVIEMADILEAIKVCARGS